MTSPHAPGPADASPPASAGATPHRTADLDRRFSAYVVDRLLGWGVAAGVAYVVLVVHGRVGLAIGAFAAAAVLLGLVTAVLIGSTGLTPGKAMLGLRVLRQRDGRPIGVPAAVGRVLVLGVAGLPTLGLGAATLGWTAAMDPSGRRRGVHDRIGDAAVVDVRPAPVAAEVVEDRPQQLVNLTAMRLLPVPTAGEAAAPTDAPGPPTDPAPSAGKRAAPLPSAPRPPGQGPDAPPPAGGPPPVPPGPRIAPPAGAAPPAAAAPAPGAHRADAPATRRRPPVATQLRRGTPALPARWRVAFDTGEELLVEGLALVGRAPEPRPGEPVRHVVPLPSSDMSLSKTHAQFQVAPDGALVVMDRGSTNGTYVLRKGHSRPLSPGRPSTLLDGDVVRFGDRTMRVVRER